MNLSRCNQGHYYDSSKNPACPYCSGQGPSAEVVQHINSISPGNVIPKTQHLNMDDRAGANDIPVTRSAYGGGTPDRGDKTIGILKAKTGIDPVVGWLVCVEGTNKGQDYRIMGGQNFLGRGDNMHIRIKGDDTISRDKHAVIIFDSKNNQFFIQGGEGRELAYINGVPVLTVKELQAYDSLEIGNSRFLFIPFCGEKFKWE